MNEALPVFQVFWNSRLTCVKSVQLADLLRRLNEH